MRIIFSFLGGVTLAVTLAIGAGCVKAPSDAQVTSDIQNKLAADSGLQNKQADGAGGEWDSDAFGVGGQRCGTGSGGKICGVGAGGEAGDQQPAGGAGDGGNGQYADGIPGPGGACNGAGEGKETVSE